MENSDKPVKGGFAKRVKEELLAVYPQARHCRIAEIAVLAVFLGSFEKARGGSVFRLETESSLIAKKFFTLLDKTINISECVRGLNVDDTARFAELIKLSPQSDPAPVNGMLLQQECCQKAFLRGAFLAAGTVSDPNKSYHLEIATDKGVLARQVLGVFEYFGISAGRSRRKSQHVVYIKESTAIVDVLGILGAPLSLLEFENVRILKDIRNDLNRKVNCEAANIKKTINAALVQIKDIDYIDSSVGIDAMPLSLREIAKLRRSFPEASLTELGQMLSPPVGKSGVNHRLRRISQFAEGLRG